MTLKSEDRDKDLVIEDNDKEKDLQISPRGSSRTRTFLEDNNTGEYTLIYQQLWEISVAKFYS